MASVLLQLKTNARSESEPKKGKSSRPEEFDAGKSQRKQQSQNRNQQQHQQQEQHQHNQLDDHENLVGEAARILSEAKSNARAESENPGLAGDVESLIAQERLLVYEMATLNEEIKVTKEKIVACSHSMNSVNQDISEWNDRNQYTTLMDEFLKECTATIKHLSKLLERRDRNTQQLSETRSALTKATASENFGKESFKEGPNPCVVPPGTKKRKRGKTKGPCPALELLAHRIERCVVYDLQRHKAYSESAALLYALQGLPVHGPAPADYRSPLHRFDFGSVRFVIDGRTVTVYDGKSKALHTNIADLPRLLSPEYHDEVYCTYCKAVFSDQARELEQIFRFSAASVPPPYEAELREKSITTATKLDSSSNNDHYKLLAASTIYTGAQVNGDAVPEVGATSKLGKGNSTDKNGAKSSVSASSNNTTKSNSNRKKAKLSGGKNTAARSNNGATASSSAAQATHSGKSVQTGKKNGPNQTNNLATIGSPNSVTDATTPMSHANLGSPNHMKMELSNLNRDDDDDDDDDDGSSRKNTRRRGARLGSRARTYDPEFKAMVLDMYDKLGDNKSMTHLARQLSIPRPNISKWVKHADKIREAVRFRRGTREVINTLQPTGAGNSAGSAQSQASAKGQSKTQGKSSSTSSSSSSKFQDATPSSPSRVANDHE